MSKNDRDETDTALKPVSSLRTHFEKLQTSAPSSASSPARRQAPDSFSAIAAGIAARSDGTARSTSEFASSPLQASSSSSFISTNGAAKARPVPAPKPANITSRTLEPLARTVPAAGCAPIRRGSNEGSKPPSRPVLVKRTTSPTLKSRSGFTAPISNSLAPPQPVSTRRLSRISVEGQGERRSMETARSEPVIAPQESNKTRTAPLPPPARRNGRPRDGVPHPSVVEADLMSLMPPEADDPRTDSSRYSPFSTPPGSDGGDEDRGDGHPKPGSSDSSSASAASQREERSRSANAAAGGLIDLTSTDRTDSAPAPVLPPRRVATAADTEAVFRPSTASDGLMSSQVRDQRTTARPSEGVSRPKGSLTPNLAVDSARQAHVSRMSSPRRQDGASTSASAKEGQNPTKVPYGFGEPEDFPAYHRSNRRPPRFQYRPWEIEVGYDTRLFACSGRYLCTGGFGVKVWNILTGEQLVSVSHEDTVKTTAICAKPGGSLQESGPKFWLGTNVGDILELDADEGYVTNSRSCAHGRADVIRMHVWGNEIWSVDIECKLLVWPSDGRQGPDLDGKTTSFRLPKPYGASAVVRGNLWYASGRDIRVVHPQENQNDKFDVLGRSLCNTDAGEITAACLGGSSSNRVFFGHADGKVSIYAADNYTCLATVTVTQGRVGTMTAVEDDLWIGFNSGMIFVYDTTVLPWIVKKDWFAHREGVSGLVHDESSVFQVDRCHVVSLGADLAVKIWDGSLQDDVLDRAMVTAESTFSTSKNLSCTVVTWNVGATAPEEAVYESQSNPIVESVFSGDSRPDIVVFGFQELVDLEDTKTTALSFFARRRKHHSHHHDHVSKQYSAWREHLTDRLHGRDPDGESYHLLRDESLVGLFSMVFVRASLRPDVNNVYVGHVKRGLGGLHGNKGGIVIRFLINETSVCLVNAHLAAGQKETSHRNSDITAILEYSGLQALQPPGSNAALRASGGDGSMVLDHDIVILNGDLNYRIDALSRELILRTLGTSNSAASTLSATVSSLLPAPALAKLLSRDQLLMSARRNPQFRLRALTEGDITFAPTYKYDVGTDRYDNSEKRRPPAWCDRILYRGADVSPNSELRGDRWYRRVEGLRVSDHRPVVADFQLRVRRVDWTLWNRAKEKAEGEARAKKRRLWEASLIRVLVEKQGSSLARAVEAVRGARSVDEVSTSIRRSEGTVGR